jgi:acyl-CoA hydrolase
MYSQFVVTEHGIADLFYKSMRERADALITIAHPDFRADLRKEAKRILY